jgi:hypothetical protein
MDLIIEDRCKLKLQSEYLQGYTTGKKVNDDLIDDIKSSLLELGDDVCKKIDDKIRNSAVRSINSTVTPTHTSPTNMTATINNYDTSNMNGVGELEMIITIPSFQCATKLCVSYGLL